MAIDIFINDNAGNGTVINSGATYSGSVLCGGILMLPNEDVTLLNETGGTINTISRAPLGNVTITATTYFPPVDVFNSGNTYNETVISGGDLELPNITHIDSNGSPVTLPAQTPFTATTCTPTTGCTNGYCRPSDWLDMPELVDGDDQINLLYAIWSGQTNYCAFDVVTTSGDYVVDWGDGTSDTYASGTQAEHEYAWTGVSSSTYSTRGYRQAMITISADTGGLDEFNTYVLHSSATTSYVAGYLDCKIASQTLDDLGDMFRCQNNQQSPYLEKFEYVGTCNVTDLSNAFYRSNLQYFIGQFTGVTNLTSCFQLSNVRFFDCKFGSSGVNPNGQFMFNLARGVKNFTNDCDISDVATLTNAFRATNIETFGTVDDPIIFNKAYNLSTCFFQSGQLREVHMAGDGYASTTSQAFRDCDGLKIVNIPVSGVSSNSLIFNQTYTVSEFNAEALTETIDLSNQDFTREQILKIFNQLGDGSGETITITNNPESGLITAADEAIAYGKNWTVVN